MARQALSLKARAIGLLAQREHSRAELRRKLLRIEAQQRAQRPLNGTAERHDDGESSRAPIAPPADDDIEADVAGSPDAAATVDALLDLLAASGYLDEARFVESRLHMRATRFGAQRIQQELAQHGLKLDAEQQATLRATELERAREVWLKRFGTEPPADAEARARQMRFLLARGFSAEAVRRLLRG